jgi:hypothetical protein
VVDDGNGYDGPDPRHRILTAVRGSPAIGVPEIPAPDEIDPSIHFTEAGPWYVAGGAMTAHQGWKLYVSMTVLNAREVIERLVQLLAPTGLRFKYVRDVAALRLLNSGAYGYAQIGKCLVIYMPRLDEDLVRALTRTASPYGDQCPAVPFARTFGDRLPIYYRYGAYTGRELELPRGSVPDEREAVTNAVPDGVEDELARFTSPPMEDPEVAGFLRNFAIFRALRQQGKCGLFHGMDLRSETLCEVALKVGYHRGQMQVDGSDGCTFLRRELAFYLTLREHGLDSLAPTLVDALDVPRHVILALEYLDGRSLLAVKLAGRLRVDHLDRTWHAMELVHRHGLFLGDAKIANVLVTGCGDLRLVDFEAAGIAGCARPPTRTFFLQPEPDDPFACDQAHFLVSVLYRYETGRYDWEDRHVSLAGLLNREPDDAPSAWALDRLKRLVGPHLAGNSARPGSAAAQRSRSSGSRIASAGPAIDTRPRGHDG